MSFRTQSLAAILTIFALAVDNPAGAQPVAPVRPRTNSFQNLFGPGGQAVPNGGFNQFGNGFNQGGNGFNQGGPIQMGGNNLLAPGIGGLQGLNAYGNGPNSNTSRNFSGQPVVFNNLGHWYSNSYGHWYPGGVTSGAGVAGLGGGGGGLGGGGGGLGGGFGSSGGSSSPSRGGAVFSTGGMSGGARR